MAGAIDDRLERRQRVTPALLRRFIPAAHRITVTTRGGRRIVSGPPIAGETLRARAGRGARRVGDRRGADRRARAPASTARGC